MSAFPQWWLINLTNNVTDCSEITCENFYASMEVLNQALWEETYNSEGSQKDILYPSSA